MRSFDAHLHAQCYLQSNSNTAVPHCCCADPEIVLLSNSDPDIADLDGGSVAEITFPNPNNLTSFKVKVRTKLNGQLFSRSLVTLASLVA